MMRRTALSTALALFALCLPAVPAWAQEDPPIPTEDDVITSTGLGRNDTGEEGDGTPLNILFLGNSYTAAAGGQQNLVPALLRSQGRTVIVDDHINAGETIPEHWLRNQGQASPRRLERPQRRLREAKTEAERAAARANLDKIVRGYAQNKGELTTKLKSRDWDVVVVQAWIAGWQPEEMHFQKYVRLLVDHIRETNPKAKVVLYVTWAGRETTINSCNEAAKANDLFQASAMVASRKFAEARPDVMFNRNERDGHPGPVGAYIIACTLYAAITGQNPVGLPNAVDIPPSYDFHKGSKNPTERYEIDADLARLIQTLAWETHQEMLDWSKQAGVDGYASD